MSDAFKTPVEQSNNMLKIEQPTHKPTPQELDDEVRSMFKNRQEGLDYIAKNYQEGSDKENAMKRLDKVYPEDITGKEYHDIQSRQWFKVNKVNGDYVYLTSPSGFRLMKRDAFDKMVDESPLNKPGTWTQKVVNGGK